MQLATGASPSPCPAITPAARLATRAGATPADPPTVEEIIAVTRTAGGGPDGVRLRALIVVLWRAGLRIGEALAPAETDLDARRGAVLVRHGKGDKRREVGMDSWAWEHLEALAAAPRQVPGRPVVLRGPRPDRWAQLAAGIRAPPAGPDRRRSGSEASVRATPLCRPNR
jgi:integrase